MEGHTLRTDHAEVKETVKSLETNSEDHYLVVPSNADTGYRMEVRHFVKTSEMTPCL